MKNIFIYSLLIISILCNQTFAYYPSNEVKELTNLIETSLESKISDFEFSKSKMTEKDFRKLKRKLLRTLNNQKKAVLKMSNDEQLAYVESRVQKKFKRAKKIITRVLKKENLMRRLAIKRGMTFEELQYELKAQVNQESLESLLENIYDEVKNEGSYRDLIDKKIKELRSLSYSKLCKKIASAQGRTPANIIKGIGALLYLFLVFIPYFIIYLTVTIIGLIAILVGVALLVGGSVVALPVTIAGVVGVGLPIYLLIKNI
ncbi:MAG: hypothetical protein N4A33_08470 [Bacteriovoracaceae bacterium]|jgi:hypothetical protein|nr:hypothetical protein [Bacteriovoracaceae bacterium]